jgi:hypothetical protein
MNVNINNNDDGDVNVDGGGDNAYNAFPSLRLRVGCRGLLPTPSMRQTRGGGRRSRTAVKNAFKPLCVVTLYDAAGQGVLHMQATELVNGDADPSFKKRFTIPLTPVVVAAMHAQTVSANGGSLQHTSGMHTHARAHHANLLHISVYSGDKRAHAHLHRHSQAASAAATASAVTFPLPPPDRLLGSCVVALADIVDAQRHPHALAALLQRGGGCDEVEVRKGSACV